MFFSEAILDLNGAAVVGFVCYDLTDISVFNVITLFSRLENAISEYLRLCTAISL